MHTVAENIMLYMGNKNFFPFGPKHYKSLGHILEEGQIVYQFPFLGQVKIKTAVY